MPRMLLPRPARRAQPASYSRQNGARTLFIAGPSKTEGWILFLQRYNILYPTLSAPVRETLPELFLGITWGVLGSGMSSDFGECDDSLAGLALKEIAPPINQYSGLTLFPSTISLNGSAQCFCWRSNNGPRRAIPSRPESLSVPKPLNLPNVRGLARTLDSRISLLTKLPNTRAPRLPL